MHKYLEPLIQYPDYRLKAVLQDHYLSIAVSKTITKTFVGVTTTNFRTLERATEEYNTADQWIADEFKSIIKFLQRDKLYG